MVGVGMMLFTEQNEQWGVWGRTATPPQPAAPSY